MNKTVGAVVLCLIMASGVRTESDIGAPIIGAILSGTGLATSVGFMAVLENWHYSTEGKELEAQIAAKVVEVKESNARLAAYTVVDAQRADLLLQNEILKAELRSLKQQRPTVVKMLTSGANSITPVRIGFWAASGIAAVALLTSAGLIAVRGRNAVASEEQQVA